MRVIKLEQIGGKVRGTFTDQKRPLPFSDWMTAIAHCNQHQIAIKHVATIPPFFAQHINHISHEE